MTTPSLLVKLLSENATLPARGSAAAAGYDLFSSETTVVPADGKALVKTDIAVALPEGCYGRVASRSSLASKHNVHTGAGVVDADYRGEVRVMLFNVSNKDYPIEKGDRIAQLILERIYTPEIRQVAELDETARGAGGFGSTGKGALHSQTVSQSESQAIRLFPTSESQELR